MCDQNDARSEIAVAKVIKELCAAADEAFKNCDGTDAWTDRILKALAGLAPEGACVDPDVSAMRRGRGRRKNEYIWDLSISSWPQYEEVGYEYPKYFEVAAESSPRLLLIAESEWGDSRTDSANGYKVMDDFCKLLHARAPLKVMAFGYRPEQGTACDKLQKQMTRLIRAVGDNVDYVLFGVPWSDEDYRWVHVKKGEQVDAGQRKQR